MPRSSLLCDDCSAATATPPAPEPARKGRRERSCPSVSADAPKRVPEKRAHKRRARTSSRHYHTERRGNRTQRRAHQNTGRYAHPTTRDDGAHARSYRTTRDCYVPTSRVSTTSVSNFRKRCPRQWTSRRDYRAPSASNCMARESPSTPDVGTLTKTTRYPTSCHDRGEDERKNHAHRLAQAARNGRAGS